MHTYVYIYFFKGWRTQTFLLSSHLRLLSVSLFSSSCLQGGTFIFWAPSRFPALSCIPHENHRVLIKGMHCKARQTSVPNLTVPLSHVTLSLLIFLSKPQFPHLLNWNKSNSQNDCIKQANSCKTLSTLAATWYILPVIIIFVTSYCSKISKTVLPQKTQDTVGKWNRHN